MNFKAKLADVAAACGLSLTTASHALSGNPRIPDPTRRKVETAARRLRYRPDPAAQMLGRRASLAGAGRCYQTIGILLTPDEHRRWNARRKPWQNALRERLDAYGYGLDAMTWRPSSKSFAQIQRVLRARGIRSIIMAAGGADTSTLPMDWSGFTTVCYAADPLVRHLHNLVTDNYADTVLACERAVSLGYRRIGMVLVGMEHRRETHEPVVGGYLAAARQFDFEPRLETIDGRDPRRSAAGIARLIRNQALDCVLSPWGGLLETTHRLGHPLPAGCGFAALDLLDAPAGMAGIESGRVARNRVVADILHSLLVNNERGIPENPMLVTFSGRWRDGASLPRKQAR